MKIFRVLPIPEMVPPEMFTRQPIGQPTFILRSPDSIAKINPQIHMQNVGDEPIEAVKVETRLVMLTHKDKDGKWWSARQDELQQFNQLEPLLVKKIQPNDINYVPFGRGIVSLLKDAPVRGREDQEHFAQIEVRLFGRLVQAAGFDEAQDPAVQFLYYSWTPKDFREADCKAFLDKYNPSVTRGGRSGNMLPILPAK
jgi:hypothetical protein